MARVWRVHHRPQSGEVGEVAVLSADESHHVRRVLRLREGDPLRLFDGRGREWESTLIECSPARVALSLGEELSDTVEPDLNLVLFQGLCRPERMDWVIQKATECGCAGIHPWVASRGTGPPPSESRLNRWRRVALESCKQSGRRRVPDIEPHDTLPAPGPAELALLLDPGPAGEPLATRIAGTRPAAVWLAVGPESGLSAEEAEALARAGWHRTALGPRTLRTETAGIVAAAIVLHRWADLGSDLAGRPITPTGS